MQFQKKDSFSRLVGNIYRWRLPIKFLSVIPHLTAEHKSKQCLQCRSQMEMKRFQTGKNGLPPCSEELDS